MTKSRTEPGAVIGEARIGLDQHMAVGGGKDVVEAVVGDGRGNDLAGAGVGPRRNGAASAGGLVIEYGGDRGIEGDADVGKLTMLEKVVCPLLLCRVIR